MILPTRTQAIVFTRPLRAAFHTDIRLPEMDDDGLLVRTEYSTISRGTELDLYTGQMHGRGVNNQWYPLLPGYIPVGIVEYAGKNVTHLTVGDRVIGSNLFSGFDECYCPAWAGHTGYVVFSHASHRLAARRAVKVPPGVPPERAGLAMLAGVAWHGVKEKIKPGPNDLIVVIGQGVIGMFSAQLCRLFGARTIVVDQYENRLATARANGLTETVQTDSPAIAETVLDYTGGEAPTAVIEVTGEIEPFRQALELARPYGRVQAQGMYLDSVPPDILRILFNKNLTISATGGETPELTQEAVNFIANGKITTEGLLSSIAEPSQATEVYDAVYRFPDKYVTSAFRW